MTFNIDAVLSKLDAKAIKIDVILGSAITAGAIQFNSRDEQLYVSDGKQWLKVPKEQNGQANWRCGYCGHMNEPAMLDCHYCGAAPVK